MRIFKRRIFWKIIFRTIVIVLGIYVGISGETLLSAGWMISFAGWVIVFSEVSTSFIELMSFFSKDSIR